MFTFPNDTWHRANTPLVLRHGTPGQEHIAHSPVARRVTDDTNSVLCYAMNLQCTPASVIGMERRLPAVVVPLLRLGLQGRPHLLTLRFVPLWGLSE